MNINFSGMYNEHKNRYYFKAAAWKTGSLVGGTNIGEMPFDKKIVFKKEFLNFRRLDHMSNAVCSSIAVLLNQLDLYPLEKKLSIPVFFSNSNGSLFSDEKYYRDYCDFGEKAGRANLFLYTLPTSPLGEASVHFGLTGSLLYITSDNSLKAICETVMNSSEDYREGVLIGIGEHNNNDADALFIYLTKETTASSEISIEQLADSGISSLSEIKGMLKI